MAKDEKTAEQAQAPEGSTPEAETGQQQAQSGAAANAGAEEKAEQPRDLEAELEAALAQVEAAKEQELRAQAEMQNVRRRAERDVEQAHKFGLEKMAQELLPVVDNLERALQAMESTDEGMKAMRDGVELTLDSFIKALSKFNIAQLDPEGEPFDPQEHQAMSMVENSEVEPNTVVAVLQKGYTLHGRLLRPAMVMVSKAAAPPKIDEQA